MLVILIWSHLWPFLCSVCALLLESYRMKGWQRKERSLPLTTEGGGQGLKDQDPLSTYTNTRTLSRIQLLILKLLNPLQEVTFSKQFSRN